ncbi:MAG: hypothetical protein AB1465_06100 [Patescibacteria group bacterium]
MLEIILQNVIIFLFFLFIIALLIYLFYLKSKKYSNEYSEYFQEESIKLLEDQPRKKLFIKGLFLVICWLVFGFVIVFFVKYNFLGIGEKFYFMLIGGLISSLFFQLFSISRRFFITKFVYK